MPIPECEQIFSIILFVYTIYSHIPSLYLFSLIFFYQEYLLTVLWEEGKMRYNTEYNSKWIVSLWLTYDHGSTKLYWKRNQRMPCTTWTETRHQWLTRRNFLEYDSKRYSLNDSNIHWVTVRKSKNNSWVTTHDPPVDDTLEALTVHKPPRERLCF